MKPLYNYRPYPTPRCGLFRLPGENYGPEGWEVKETQLTIIGEADGVYVTQLLHSETSEWGKKSLPQILPIGPHKSRLVEWQTGQLSLFKMTA